MLAKIQVTLKNGVLDPQGKAALGALRDLGYEEALDVKIGKLVEVRLDGVSEAEADKRVREMCDKLLANTVIENYEFTLTPQ